MSASKYLATYLNDHLAGSTAVLEVVRRAARENEGNELGTFLSQLSGEIAADREALREIMAGVGVSADRPKLAAAWTAEKLGRLKPNAQLRGYSPLSPLVELEVLLLGITGKLHLWTALADVADDHGLDAARLAELSARAERQRSDVEKRRVQVARDALR
jgi:ABC-type hemin transport system ATPase subunit